MAMQALTIRGIEALKPQAKRYEVFDALTPGLAIRVTPHGHTSWVLFYRHHGRLRRLTVGRYLDRPLAEARSEAIRERGRILDGADPATEKHDERATYGDTVGALYDLYKKATEKKRSWSEQRRIFEKEVARPCHAEPCKQSLFRDRVLNEVDLASEVKPEWTGPDLPMTVIAAKSRSSSPRMSVMGAPHATIPSRRAQRRGLKPSRIRLAEAVAGWLLRTGAP